MARALWAGCEGEGCEGVARGRGVRTGLEGRVRKELEGGTKGVAEANTCPIIIGI